MTPAITNTKTRLNQNKRPTFLRGGEFSGVKLLIQYKDGTFAKTTKERAKRLNIYIVYTIVYANDYTQTAGRFPEKAG